MAIFLISVFLLVYFVPTIIGSSKQHGSAIFILNLFLGWTFIGWVGALIWAMVDPKESVGG